MMPIRRERAGMEPARRPVSGERRHLSPRIVGAALLSIAAIGVRAADMPGSAAFRRVITLASPSGPVEIVVPPVQGLTYFALHTDAHGDELDLQGNVVVSIVEAGHSQMTLTAQKASIRKQALTPAEASAIVDLESMRSLDQQYRSRPGVTADDMRLQAKLDDASKTRLVSIVDRLGWPTYSAVGMAAAEAAFLVLHHCGDLALQTRYVPLLRDAAHAGQASLANLALLEDRIRSSQGKPQIYGSQLASVSPPTPKPIEDPEHVDERRASVGLEPLADYLKRFEGDNLPGAPAK